MQVIRNRNCSGLFSVFYYRSQIRSRNSWVELPVTSNRNLAVAHRRMDTVDWIGYSITKSTYGVAEIAAGGNIDHPKSPEFQHRNFQLVFQLGLTC